MKTLFEICFFTLLGTIIFSFFFQKAFMLLFKMDPYKHKDNETYTKTTRRILLIEFAVMFLVFLIHCFV